MIRATDRVGTLFVILCIFLHSPLIFAQITLVDNPRIKSNAASAELDLSAYSQWIESTQSLPLGNSVDNLFILTQSSAGNFFHLYRCNNRFNSQHLKYYNLSLPDTAQKALLKFMRTQVEFIENSFTVWIAPTVTERRQAAVSSSFACLETFHVQEGQGTSWEQCADKFSWSQPFMSKTRAYQAVQAMASLQRTMSILSCSELKGEGIFPLQDPDMVQDYLTIKRILATYFNGQFIQFETGKHISGWLERFYKP